MDSGSQGVNYIIHIVVKHPCVVYVSVALYKLTKLHYISLHYKLSRQVAGTNLPTPKGR